MVSIVWLRRDLRLHDHAPLAQALASGEAVQLVFIFDTDILARFDNPKDRRLSFLARTLCHLHAQLQQKGGGLLVLRGSAKAVIPKLAGALDAASVHAGKDFEPAAKARDTAVAKKLKDRLQLQLDHLIFDPEEVLKQDGTPFRVFTPYSKAWYEKLTPTASAPYEVKDNGRYADFPAMVQQAKAAGLAVLDAGAGEKAMLNAIGYELVDEPLWAVTDAAKRLQHWAADKIGAYDTQRDLMAENDTSQLSPYLRFGLVSIRECMRAAQDAGDNKGVKTWIKELVWREFYAMILHHFPHTVDTEFNEKYRGTLQWPGRKEYFAAWQEGRTGYPVVDAAMRQLKQDGWMHNRARMIVASFLTKDLLVDWRKGEEHFAQYLMDYEQASNVGGWQWAASTGTDAQPWFRIFNPVLQSKKFDPDGAYIRRYVPELRDMKGKTIHEPWKEGLFGSHDYPQPIVNHKQAREQALALFKQVSAD